jgi:hypothetical protein
MRRITLRSTQVFAAVMFLTFGMASVNPGVSKTAKRPSYYSIRTNRVMRVRLNRDLDSERESVGNKFSATLVDPLFGKGGVILAPQGSRVGGRITNVRRAQKKGQPAALDVEFVSLRLPNGARIPINGSLFDLSTSGATSDNEGQITADKTSHRKAKFIGGGAAGGALIGAIAGGGKGLAIGAGAGALAGAITGRLKKGHEVKIKSGTEFGVIVNRAFALPEYKARS